MVEMKGWIFDLGEVVAKYWKNTCYTYKVEMRMMLKMHRGQSLENLF